METMHKKKKRYRCDYCRKLIPVKSEQGMVIMDGRSFSTFDNRWYHFCNHSQWGKAFNGAYQLSIEFASDGKGGG